MTGYLLLTNGEASFARRGPLEITRAIPRHVSNGPFSQCRAPNTQHPSQLRLTNRSRRRKGPTLAGSQARKLCRVSPRSKRSLTCREAKGWRARQRDYTYGGAGGQSPQCHRRSHCQQSLQSPASCIRRSSRQLEGWTDGGRWMISASACAEVQLPVLCSFRLLGWPSASVSQSAPR